MASSLSRGLYQSLIRNPNSPSMFHVPLLRFCTNSSTSEALSDLDNSDSSPSPESNNDANQRKFFDRPLQDGVEMGIFKAILIGLVGQNPVEKKLRSGRTVKLLSLGTGGIRNNRRPLEHENPKDYANRGMVQWHRVSIYPERLGTLAMKHAVAGSMLYLEGNLETKIFTDPITGLVRRVREVAIRRNGRIVFLSNSSAAERTPQVDLKGVGYY